MKTLKNKLLVALVVAFMLTLGAAIIPTVGMQVNAAETDSVQITLTDGIAVKYYATLGADVTEATATFESETAALNATVKGEKSGDKWVFCYNEVTPQYIDATLSVKVNGETKVENYSVLTYLNTIINGNYAEAEKTVAKDLVYYGEAAKAYKFCGTVAATPGTAYAGESKMNLGTKFADDTRIYSATVVFDTLPAITFGFKKASETAKVSVDGKDVTNELAKGENGVYTYTLTGIYAIDFDKQYNVVLTDGENTQTLSYSINDYAARMQNSENEAMKTLAKALYCYGAGAEALKTYQEETYVVVTEPTYTETGVAKNGKGKEITLPKLNATNYKFTQKTKDGDDYKITKDSQGNITYSDYAKGTLGTATFTHKTFSEIVIKKEITADTITFSWTEYNNVDIHWRVAATSKYKDKMTGEYVDGTYVLTLLNGAKIDIPNLNSLNSAMKTNAKITGDGTLNITKETQPSSFENVTVDNVSFTHNGPLSAKSITVTGDKAKATLNKKFSGSVIVKAGELTINEQLTVPANGTLEVAEKATLNVTANGNTVNVADDGVLELYGTVNITSKTKGKATAICLSNNSSIKISSDSRVTITDYEYAFGKWVDNGKNEDGTPVGRKGNLYIPSTSAISGNYVKEGEVNLVDASTCKYFYSSFSISVNYV